jgi:hypothetical protein
METGAGIDIPVYDPGNRIPLFSAHFGIFPGRRKPLHHPDTKTQNTGMP